MLLKEYLKNNSNNLHYLEFNQETPKVSNE